MNDYLAIVYYSFFFVGLIFSVLSLFIFGNSGSILIITSYSFLIAGLFLFIMSLLNQVNFTSLVQFLSIFKNNLGPFTVLLGILGYLLYLSVAYQTKIAQGHISSNYYVFNNLSIILICIQIGIFYNALNHTEYKNTKTIPATYSTFAYLLSVITIIFALTLGNILKYFSVDG